MINSQLNSDEREERLRQIRARHRMVMFAYASEDKVPQAASDIDFLLSLYDSQAPRASVAVPQGDVPCLGRFPTPSQADDDYPCDVCGAAKTTHSQAALLWDSLAHNLSSLTSRMASRDCGPVWDSFWALDAHLRAVASPVAPSPIPDAERNSEDFEFDQRCYYCRNKCCHNARAHAAAISEHG